MCSPGLTHMLLVLLTTCKRYIAYRVPEVRAILLVHAAFEPCFIERHGASRTFPFGCARLRIRAAGPAMCSWHESVHNTGICGVHMHASQVQWGSMKVLVCRCVPVCPACATGTARGLSAGICRLNRLQRSCSWPG